MNSNIIELDNSDQMLIYQQNHQQKKGQISTNSNQGFQKPSSNVSKTQMFQQNKKSNDKGKNGLIQLPTKFALKPSLLKYIDRIQIHFLQQKTPNQIQIMLKEPTLLQIQYILKEKIHTFLNIIFQSSHCFTQDQVQKIRPQINQKIQRISLELLDPFRNNFIDKARYQNFLKLMKYHKEGRRSQKISKKCNTFFRLFFLKMKFQGISHTEGNAIQLNESKNKNKDSFEDENGSQEESDFQENKQQKNKKSNKNDPLYGSKSSNKKYFYGKQIVVNQKMMDDAKQSLLNQIRNKGPFESQSQKQNHNKKNEKKQDKNISQNKPEVQIIDDEDSFQWTFDRQNSMLFILFECHFKKSKISKIIRLINEKFSKKYEKVRKQPLDLGQITSKIQSMFSISCQKFIRRIKYLTIKQGLQNNPNQNSNQNRKENANMKPSRKKKVYSILDIQKSIEIQNDQKNLSKQDEFYFSKLKQHLKALQAKQVYLSSSADSQCFQEWSFMLEFIREFYFSVLEEFKFDHLLQYAKRVIQMNTIEKNLWQTPIPIEDQDNEQVDEEEEKKKQKDCEKDLLQKLPKSSFCFTLSRMGKSRQQSTNQQDSIEKAKNCQNQIKELQFVSIDEILRKSYNQNVSDKKVSAENNTLQKSSSKEKPPTKQIKTQVCQKQSIVNHVKEKRQKTQQKTQQKSPLQNKKGVNNEQKKMNEFKRMGPVEREKNQKLKEQQSTLQNTKTIKRLGQPLKKLKQNETVEIIQQQKIQYESDDEFEEILQLSSSIQERFLQQQSPKYLEQMEQKQTDFERQQQQENIVPQQLQKQKGKTTISVKPRGPRCTYREQEILGNQEIEELIRKIQNKANDFQQQEQGQQQSIPLELSIIHQQEEEDGSQNISNPGEKQITKNLLPLEDQYSIYEIDEQAQQSYVSHFQELTQKLQKKNTQNTDNISKINKMSQKKTDQSQPLQVILKELQKIKSMGNSQTHIEQKLYSSEKFVNKDFKK